MKWFVSLVLVALLMAGCGGQAQKKAVQEEAKDDPIVPLLIPCKACKKEVSKSGEACANCSYPIADSVVAYKKAAPAPEGEAFTIPGLAMEMLWCKPGTFMMGSPESEKGREQWGKKEAQHKVTLTQGFWLGKHEVTQAQYETVMNGNSEGLNAKPSNWPNNDDRPVEKVSWEDAQVFLSRLNSIEQTAGRLPDGWEYALPTEAQWEYACRAGTTTAYSWGATISPFSANYNWDGGWNTGSDFKQTRDVGQYAANPWGFHDMHGNVWEWVADRNGAYPSGPLTDPTGPASGSSRVRRGGSWSHTGTYLRSARRRDGAPGARGSTLGFRVGFKASQ